MKKFYVIISLFFVISAMAQELPAEYEGQSCTSIMVGRDATTDGSVILTHLRREVSHLDVHRAC